MDFDPIFNKDCLHSPVHFSEPGFYSVSNPTACTKSPLSANIVRL